MATKYHYLVSVTPKVTGTVDEISATALEHSNRKGIRATLKGATTYARGLQRVFAPLAQPTKVVIVPCVNGVPHIGSATVL